jgi:hypothetical protein
MVSKPRNIYASSPVSRSRVNKGEGIIGCSDERRYPQDIFHIEVVDELDFADSWFG